MAATMSSSIVVSARADARDVATLTKAWIKQTGMAPKTTSMLVGDSLATLAGILEQNDQSLHVETIEEAYQIIQESQLHAHSNQSRRAAFGTLRQETTNGFVPRQQPNLDTGFTTGFTTPNKPKINDLERDLDIAKSIIEHSIETGIMTPEEGEAKLITDLAKIRLKHNKAKQERVKQVQEGYKQSLIAAQIRPQTQPQYNVASEPTMARADMTAEQRAAFEKAESQRLKSGLSGGFGARQDSGSNIVAHNREEALAVLQHEADKRAQSGIMNKKEIEEWLARSTAKVNEAYDKLETGEQS